MAQNSNFKLELQFELSITIQLRQSVSSKKGLFGFAYIEKYLEVQHNILKSESHLPKDFFWFALMIALQKWWKMLFISS